ncbi:DUF6998 domain-containing protein [Marinicellulosiphila megalodicopiae]|uniref:DUF6998 domain-containing protein n=1 Tax=Marinicellulosiphila megalodicopiae TaxID=2724896 RepID=UPI003BB0419E
MALNQMQTIQSLANNLSMLQQEVEVFGIAATEIRHLVGRIGELYSCVITNGQMAPNTNEKGYDVVSSIGERISVKTTAMTSGGSAKFNSNTLEFVDRVMIMRINEDLEIEVLLDASIDNAKALMHKDKIAYSKLLKSDRKNIDLENIPVVKEAKYKNYKLVEHENGSIVVYKNDEMMIPAKPVLREIASFLNVSILNANGNKHNTRTLGSIIINSIV